MVNQTIATPVEQDKPLGDAVAVSAEEYMEHYAEHHYEWVQGVAYKMSPVSLRHDQLVNYTRKLLEAYFALNPIGTLVGAPFVQSIASVGSKREPDLQVILKSNPGQLTATAMIGPADICIEVVSPGSEETDYGKKFREYEAGGVQEYWIFDPLRREHRFYRLQPTKLYATVPLDADGYYETPLLPRFRLHVATLWEDELPNFYAIAQAVQAMFKDE